MSKFKENIINILLILLNMLFSFQIIKQSYFIVDYKTLYVLVIFLLSTLLYYMLSKLIRYNIKSIFVLLAGLALVSLYLYRSYFFLRIANDMESNINTLINSVNSSAATYFDQYKLFIVLIVPVLVIIFLFASEKGFGNIIIFYTLSIMILFWFIGFSNVVNDYIKWYIPLAIVNYAVNSSSLASKKLKKKNYKFSETKGKVFILTIVPAIIITFIVLSLPREFDGNYESQIKSKFVNNYAGKNSTTLAKNAYGLQVSGYSDSSKKLGGSLVLNNDLVLKVKANQPEYLRSVVKDYYTGEMWEKTSENYEKRVQKEGNLLSSSPGLINKLDNSETMTIYPVNTKITSLFAPMYTYNVSLPKGSFFYDKIPTFIADIKNSDYYTLKYYADKEAKSFENCKDILWLKEDKELQPAEKFNVIYKDYMQLPDTITERTKELQKNIVSSSKSRYEDIESIQQYLSKSFPYSLSVSDNIQSKDFVDDFLFNEKKGYCVYFATAATVLCRMSGIPARYVEGFKMYDNKNSKGIYEVTNAEAHAWCEVLVDPDMGLWSVMEATPGSLWVAPNVEETRGNISSVPAVANNPIPSALNKEEIKNGKDTSNNETVKVSGVKFSKIQIAILVISLLLICLLAKIISEIKAIKKILASDSMIPLYKYTMKRLKQIGIVKPDNMPELEYAHTISDYQLKVVVRKLSENVYEEFYGKKKVKGIDKLLLYNELENYIKYSQSKTIYFLKKYIFL